MPAKLSEGIRRRHAHSIATHATALEGIGRRAPALGAGLGTAPGLLTGPVRGFPADGADVHLDVIGNRLWVAGRGFIDPASVFTRASPAWAFDNTGTLRQYGTNEIRRVPSPVGLPSWLREPASTNAIRNNSMTGAVNGAPGTPPTNWQKGDLTTGIATEIVGTGTENGLPYLDVRWSGTATAATAAQVFFEAATIVAAAQGQTWTNSVYLRVVAGSLGVSVFFFRLIENGAAGNYLQETAFNPSLTSALARFTSTVPVVNASAAFLRPGIYASVPNGATIDVTLRIAAPQLEQQAFPTSPILTSGSAVTRARDEFVVPLPTIAAGQAHSQVIDFVLPFDRADWNRLTGDNAIALAIQPANGRLEVWNGSQAPNTTNAYTKGARGKAAYAGDAVGRSICLNGGPIAGDSQTHPTLSRVILGQLGVNSDGQSPLLHIHDFRTYSRRLSNEQLRLLTA